MRVREQTVFTRQNSTFACPFAAWVLAVAAATVLQAQPAAAQNLFEALFGAPRRPYAPPSASSYAEPQSHFSLFGSARPGETVRHSDAGAAGGGGGVAYCVRLCDGRYFPIQRSSGASPVQVCSSFCPAT